MTRAGVQVVGLVAKAAVEGGLRDAAKAGAKDAARDAARATARAGARDAEGAALRSGERELAGTAERAGARAAGHAGESGATGTARRSMPDWLRQRFERGRQFNRDNWSRFGAEGDNLGRNEIKLENGKILDSYNPDDAIVSRKLTQLGEVTPETAKSYIREAGSKYSPGEIISDTAKAQRDYPELIGRRLNGDLVLEVPVQHGPIPREIIDYAERQVPPVEIRDVTGRPLH